MAHNNRTAHRQAVQSMRALMQQGPVTVEAGPCAGMVVKDEKTLLDYSKKLDRWFFPADSAPYVVR